MVAPASHHWYPDKEVLRQNLGKDLLVSDEEWQRVVDIGYDKVTNWIFFPDEIIDSDRYDIAMMTFEENHC